MGKHISNRNMYIYQRQAFHNRVSKQNNSHAASQTAFHKNSYQTNTSSPPPPSKQ